MNKASVSAGWMDSCRKEGENRGRKERREEGLAVWVPLERREIFFPFGTVNNSPCLSWTAFTAPFVCSDILGSLKSGEGLASRVFTAMGKAEY